MQSLLENLAMQTGATCISDLFGKGNDKVIRRCVDAIPTGAYSLAQWTQAVRYLAGDNSLTPRDESEARTMLGGKTTVGQKSASNGGKSSLFTFKKAPHRDKTAGDGPSDNDR